MKIHDNGHEMKNGEVWWVAWVSGFTDEAREHKTALAKVEGDRPYQQLKIHNEYPSEVWVLYRCSEVPIVFETEIDGERTLLPVRWSNPKEGDKDGDMALVRRNKRWHMEKAPSRESRPRPDKMGEMEGLEAPVQAPAL